MTDVMTMTVPYNDAREINLVALLPNYQYDVNIAIGTANGLTPSVLVVPPTLAAAGNTISGLKYLHTTDLSVLIVSFID